MSFVCPHCQFEDALATADATCGRCGTPLDPLLTPAAEATPSSDSSLLVIEALPSEIVAQQAAAAQAKRPRPGLFEAIVLTLVTFIAAVVLVAPLSKLLATIKPDLTLYGDHLLLLGGMVVLGVMGCCGWFYLSPQAAQRMALGKPRWLHVLIALALPLLLQVVLMKAASLLLPDGFGGQLGNWPNESSHWYYYYVIAEQPWPLMLLVGAILPAFCEEVFFRGCIGRGLVARYGILLGVLLTSVLFGVVHWEPRHIASAFCLGVVMHFVYLCSHSLWPAIVLHLINNVLAFSMYRLQIDGVLTPRLVISWPLASGAALGTLGLLWVLWRTRRHWEPGETPPEPRLYFSLERPGDDARLVSPPWRWTDMAVMAACLLIFGSATLAIGKEGWSCYVAREHVALADAAFLLGEYDEAKEAYEAALRAAPNYPAALHGRAAIALRFGEYHDALADADRCLQQASQDAPAIATRARALVGLGKSDEAMANALQAVSLAPNDEWCVRMLMEVAVETQSYSLTLDAALRGSEMVEDPTYYESMLAWVYLHCENAAYRNAGRGYEYARRVAERTHYQDVSALIELTHAAVAIGDVDEAVRWCKAVAALGSEEDRLAAAQVAESLADNWRLVLKLRRAWGTDFVDDVTRFPYCKKLLVVGPASYLSELRKERLGLLGYEGWTFEAVTYEERQRRLAELAVRLANTPGVDPKMANIIAWRIGPTLEDILNCKPELVAKPLGIDEAEATSLLEVIRQNHSRPAVNKSR